MLTASRKLPPQTQLARSSTDRPRSERDEENSAKETHAEATTFLFQELLFTFDMLIIKLFIFFSGTPQQLMKWLTLHLEN